MDLQENTEKIVKVSREISANLCPESQQVISMLLDLIVSYENLRQTQQTNQDNLYKLVKELIEFRQ
jgi:hypothetical protein